MNRLINKLKNLSPDSSELLKKGGSALFIRMVGFGMGYLFVLMVTNWFGSKANGVLSLAITFVMISTILSRLGIDTSLVKFTANLKNNSLNNLINLYTKGVIISSLISVLISSVIYLGSSFISTEIFNSEFLDNGLKIIAFSIPAWTLVQINAAILRGYKLTNWYTFYFQTGRFLLAVLILLFGWIILDYKSFHFPILAYTIGCIVMAISSSIHIYILFKRNRSKKNEINSAQIPFNDFIRQSIPMLFSASLIFLMGWLSTIVLGIYRTEEEVGIFNVCFKLAGLTSFVLTALNSIAAPKFSESFNSGEIIKFQKLVKNTSKIIFISTLPVIIFLLIFSEFALKLFGQEFIEGKNALLILLIGQFINCLAGSVGNIMNMTGHQKEYQKVLLIGLFINALLSFILIPELGILGAAIATSLGTIAWNLLAINSVKTKLHVNSTFINFAK